MTDAEYKEYKVVPAEMGYDADLFWNTTKLLQTLEKLAIVKVRPVWHNRPHDVVTIIVDEVVYDEPMLDWIKRFQ